MRWSPQGAAIGVLLAASSAAVELPEDPVKPLVIGHCSACHSLDLVTSQRGDEAFWLKTIRWMQETQNLWVIPQDQETAIVSYLARHLGEGDFSRRPNLAVELRPPVSDRVDRKTD